MQHAHLLSHPYLGEIRACRSGSYLLSALWCGLHGIFCMRRDLAGGDSNTFHRKHVGCFPSLRPFSSTPDLLVRRKEMQSANRR